MVLMLFGWALSIFIASPESVVRSDGSRPAIPTSYEGLSLAQRSAQIIKREVLHFIETICNWRIISLIPMFFAANFL
jgi:hypothetical protein